jgi:nicotinamidase-related amidase
MTIPIAETALLLCDLQNDFIHADGAYGRAGQGAAEIAALPARIQPLAKAMRHAGGWIVATQFTLVAGRDGAPMISPHLQRLRPFLAKGDFVPHRWGHAIVDELQPVDFAVEKIAYSAFFNTRLEWVLRRVGIRRLLVCGIVTNGGVASTLRDAHVRDFEVVLLEDGCAAFSTATHDATIASLRGLCPVISIGEALQEVAQAASFRG